MQIGLEHLVSSHRPEEMAVKMHPKAAMSCNPWGLRASNGRPQQTDGNTVPLERRKRIRAHVHWNVVLMRKDGSDPVQTTTENLSSGGLYCISPVPLGIGELLVCTLRFPAHDPRGGNRLLTLQCTVEVLRSEAVAAAVGFGTACQIQDYHLIT
jgi:hypothetical protein